MSLTGARSFLDSVYGFTSAPRGGPIPTQDRSIMLGTIDPDYTVGLARVLFDGETEMSVKGYAWMAAYKPTAGDRVMLMPAGQSYIIAGAVETHTAFPLIRSLTMAPGWERLNDVHHAPGYTITEEGVVSVVGTIKRTAAALTVVNGMNLIATLPLAARPAVRQQFVSMADDNEVLIQVETDGSILQEVSATGAVGNFWMTLNPVMFQTNEELQWVKPTALNSWTEERLPSYTKDKVGRIWMRGIFRRATDVTADTNVFTLPTAYAPQYDQYMLTYAYLQKPTAVADPRNFRAITRTGNYVWKTANTGALPLYTSVDQSCHHEKDTQWDTPDALLNGWANYGSVYAPISYRKDYDGLVSLRGLMKNGVAGDVIFTLPPGYRPTKTVVLASVSSALTARVDVLSNGDVILRYGSTPWASLDGVSFVAGQ